MVDFLGWFNVVLIAVALSMVVLRRTNRYFYKNKNATLRKLSTYTSKLHPYIGMLVILTGFIHGTMALGTFRIHTGWITWVIICIMAVIAVVGKQLKVQNWVQFHRSLGILLILSIFLHIFYRNIF